MTKSAILNLLKASGAFDLVRIAHSRRALILTYHRFSNGEEEDKTSARMFTEQLEYLTSRYCLLPLGELVEYLNGPGPSSGDGGRNEGRNPNRSGRRLAAITIDDGYSDAYEIAYPLLRRYKVPATIFVVPQFADRRQWIWTDKARYLCLRANRQDRIARIDGHELRFALGDEASRSRTALELNNLLKTLPNEVKEEALERVAELLGVSIPSTPPEELRSITWEEAKEMDGNGIEIGSHTMTHPILTHIGDEQLRQELSESRLRLEEVLGRRVEQFCYPNGDHDERVQREVARAGYRVAVTTVNGLNKRGDDPLTLRRVHTERDLAHFIQSTSGFEQLKDKWR